MSQQTKGFVLVFISAFSFSLLPIFTKLAYALGISPMNLLAWRFITAAIVIWLIAPPLVGRSLFVRKIDLLHFAVQGILGYGLASIGFFTALTYLNASLVSILLYLYPAMVTLFSRIFFKEHLTVYRIVIILITFTGSLFVTNVFASSTNHVQLPGILFGVLAALAYSFFNLYSQKTTARTHPLVVSTYSLTALSIWFTLLAPRSEFLHINLKVLGIATIIGVVSTVLPIFTYLSGIKLIGASRAAVISTFEPAFTIVLAFIILGENLTLLQTLGALLIFSGVIALQLEKPQSPGPAAAPGSVTDAAG